MSHEDAFPFLKGPYDFLLWNDVAVITNLAFLIGLSYKLPIYY